MRLLQKAELPREMCYSCEKNVAGEGGGRGGRGAAFHSNELNKTLNDKAN